ncbi:MAG: hypothetical protein JWO50_584 [Candidatus Kaiserbacteria bacterium]|nr:hypothetical protein [Candidatus Kaiserbacteria bacterium]
MKFVFIAHPMSGDIEGNMQKVVAICRSIHSEEIIPVFPSALTRRYLTPDPRDRALAQTMIEEYFRRRIIDEVWLYGTDLTDGMKREVRFAVTYNIPVVAQTPQMQLSLDTYLKV